MSLLARSEALHAEVRALAAGQPSRSFDQLARAIAHFQGEFSAGYARLLAARGGVPERAELLPGVPSEAFRHARVALHAAELDVVRFLTSGTSSAERGMHAFRSLETYRALAVAFGRQALLAGGSRPYVVALAAPPSEPPSSSLGFMMALFMEQFDDADASTHGSAQRFLLGAQGIDLAALERALCVAAEQARPLLLLATSFALVELLDRLGARTLPAGAGTAIMQTGGFKGKTREIPAQELRLAVARAFDISPAQVLSEYGMTELTSQMYEATLPGSALAARHAGPHGRYYEPPWLRVVPVDPVALEPVADGEVGIARIVDLGNVDSAVAVQTRDLVRRAGGGFELLGRAPGAVPRGCSLAVEEFLAGTRGASLPPTAAVGAPRAASLPTAANALRRARIEPLLRAARAIADPAEPLGRAARAALAQTGDLSPAGCELALENCLETAPSEAELEALVAGTPECPRAHVLLSAGVFTAALRAIAIALAASEQVCVRASRRDPSMPTLLLEGAPGAFTIVDELAARAGDHVWAYGRDQTLSELAARLPAGSVLHRHGAGFGVALLDASGAHALPRLAAELARDVALFDQRGCLSPRVLLVQGGTELAERAAEALVSALAALEKRVPLGKLHVSELSQIAEYRDSARFAGRIEPAGRGFVSLASSERWLLPPIGRNLHVLAVGDPVPLLEQARQHITTVGSQVAGELEQRVRRALPAARIARFGRMQAPPFDGPVDRRPG